ncbi:MAG: DUF4268 domain-containing protein [Bacteroidetes bacterium]|nr:DUF4268 domain-containing protein [Bacteroidota bacterium]
MLGKIENIDLRDVWKHEAIDFTNWLAQPDNFQLLSEEIALDMQVIKTEANVGSFSADILAEETNTGKKIIIENQLETTNHDHLGKIITYASGLEANYIVWIFKDIREEHRRAIDWLNEITDEDLSIFAIKMELWKIGDSLPAPKFNIICSPNDWSKAFKKTSNSPNMTDNNLIQLNFWKGFADYIANQKTPFKVRKPRGQHWYDLSIGSAQVHLSFVISVKDNFLRIDLYIPDNKELFGEFKEKQDEIEKILGFSLDWQELPTAKASRIAYMRENIDIKLEKNVDDAYKWLLDNGLKIYQAFKKYIK